jgi:glycosyltransferase involved in cell wall biosynthesis
VTRILSTHVYGDRHPDWDARVDVLDRRTMTRSRLFRRLVAAAGDYDALILNGSIGMTERFVDLLAAVAIRRTRRPPPAIVLTDCSWRLGEARLDRAAMRTGIRALDGPRVRYCVRSSAELELFPRTWHVDPGRVVFTPYAHTVTPEELAVPATTDGGVFAGGNSLRDYPTLLEAVRELDVPVRILTSVIDESELPAQVRVEPIRSHDDFVDGLRRAAVVVTPIQPGLRRAAGLDTYLSAMALGKLVIVSEGPGVRDYVDHGSTGLVVPAGDPAALHEALAWALDPANADEVAAVADRAAETARTRFTYEAYVATLLRVVDELVSAPRSAPRTA